MIGLIQRVTFAKVRVNEEIVGNIYEGILAFIGIEKDDTAQRGQRLLEKILSYRIFDDSEGKMNLNVSDVNGGLLLVSQFTLAADTKTGTRAGFSTAMEPIGAENIYNALVTQAKALHSYVASGKFGANMQIELCNNGPVTFILKA